MMRNLETRFVQTGNNSDETTGAVSSPIYLSTAFKHKGMNQSTGYDYSRTKNPTRDVLEREFTHLENGDESYACSSGMAAMQLVLSLFKTGDELLVTEDVYGGTYRLLNYYEQHYKIQTTYVDPTDVADIEALITPKTKAVLLETPTNPLMLEYNISKLAAFCKAHHLFLIVDNTFLTPYLQRPLELGADIVMHSATKYIGGHNDVLAGLVTAKGKEICEQLAAFHNASGAVLSPFDSWLLIRGLKTLPLRMEKHQQNARALTSFLKDEPKIVDVIYPGKGGMLSFRLKKSEWIDPFLQQMKLITFAESLGGVESFITYPATQTHADIPVEERVKRGIDDRLLRFSVGIEQVEDLKADLTQVLNALDE